MPRQKAKSKKSAPREQVEELSPDVAEMYRDIVIDVMERMDDYRSDPRVKEMVKKIKKFDFSESLYKTEELLNDAIILVGEIETEKEEMESGEMESGEKEDMESEEEEDTIIIQEDISKLKVSELKERLGSDLPESGSGKGGRVIKADLIRHLQDKIARSSKKKQITTKKVATKKVATKKKVQTVKKVSVKKKTKSKDLKCNENGKNKCPPSDKPGNTVCRTTDGKCLTRTKAGRPRGEKAMKDKIKEYFYDELAQLVGERDEVKRHVKFWKESHDDEEEVEDLPSPGVKSKKCAELGMKSLDDYHVCDEKEGCNVHTGKCTAGSSSNLKSLSSLNVGDRIIYGDANVLKTLQKSLGGKIISPQKVPEKKESSPKKVPKKVSKKESKASAEVSELREKIKKTFQDCLQRLGVKE